MTRWPIGVGAPTVYEHLCASGIAVCKVGDLSEPALAPDQRRGKGTGQQSRRSKNGRAHIERVTRCISKGVTREREVEVLTSTVGLQHVVGCNGIYIPEYLPGKGCN